MTGPAAVVTLGETMGLLVPTSVGKLSHISSMSLSIGGAESNVAIALARQGVPVTWFGRLGTDSVGDRVVRELRAEGVVVRATRDPSAPTGLMLKERLPGGRVNVHYHRAAGAGVRLRPSDLDDEVIAEARALHVTGITPALGPEPAAAVAHAVAVARSSGTLVSVDINHRTALWDDVHAARVLRELVASADLVFAGEDEARLVLGQSRHRHDRTTDDQSTQLATALTSLGPSEAVIKRGPLGATAVSDTVVYQQPPFPIHAVDPVGAGDAFVGTYIAAYLTGSHPPERMRRAALAGALACTMPGDWEGTPSSADLAGNTGLGRDDVRR